MPFQRYPFCSKKHPTEDDYLKEIEIIYIEHYRTSPGYIDGVKLGEKRYPIIHGKWPATMWHICTSDEHSPKCSDEKRVVKPERAEKIIWLRKLTDGLGDSGNNNVAWIEERSGENRLHICLEDFSYLAVIAIRKNKSTNSTYMLPWTAYPVKEGSYRYQLQKRYEGSKTKYEMGYFS